MNRKTFGTGASIAVITACVWCVPATGWGQSTPATKPAPAAPAAAKVQGAPGRQAGLKLTDEQRTKIKALREQQQTEVKATREALRTARQKLAEVNRADTLDEQALRAAATAVAAAQTEATVQRARHRFQFLGLLTPEQREFAKQRRVAGQRAERRMRAMQNRQMRMWRRDRGMAGAMRHQGQRMARPGMGPMGPMGPGRGMWRAPDQDPPEGR